VKLTTRISVFFLIALAVVLFGFSCAIYSLVRSDLLRQVDVRALADLDTLTASIEFKSNGLEWEPNRRQMVFGQQSPGSHLAWAVYELDGHLVEGFRDADSPLTANLPDSMVDDTSLEKISWNHDDWRIAKRIIHTEGSEARVKANAAIQARDPSFLRYSALMVAVASPLAPALAPLNRLAMSLAGSAVAIWLIAATAGNWLCKKALRPVTEMARSARSISANDFDQRLPPTGTRDELEELRVAFNDLLTRLQVSFARQSRFTAEASHQLRTPLAAMLGQIDVALRRERDSDEYRRALSAAQKQAAHLHQIIETLLFLTREDAESRPPSLETVDLHHWLADYLHQWEQHPRHDDIHFETDENQSFSVDIQSVLLGEALNNLLDNACKYSDPGTPIKVRLVSVGSEVRLVVEDCGYGIPEADVPHVFHPFFRSASVRQRGIAGTGLGLSIARRIAEVFHGRLDVESTTGKGSRFIIVLPLAAEKLAVASA
jgi:heavy metal sensor kinase